VDGSGGHSRYPSSPVQTDRCGSLHVDFSIADCRLTTIPLDHPAGRGVLGDAPTQSAATAGSGLRTTLSP
jgi:hypothetical protein